MQGRVIKRGKTWSYVVDVGRNDAGKRRQKWKGGFRTKRDAQRALAELLGKVEDGSWFDASAKTVEAFLEDWLRLVSPRLRPTTSASYGEVIHGWVVPRIGSVVLTAVSPMTLMTLYAQLTESGRRDGKGGLSASSVTYCHRILKQALGNAVQWGLLQRNPADLVSPPRKSTPEMSTWSADKARRFLAAVAGDRLYALWLLLVMTGMRRGEALGLRWRDVDLAAGRIAIRQTLLEVNYKTHFGEPKTKGSRRSVSIDATTITALVDHRERQLAERLPTLEPSTDAALDLVFTQTDGRPMQPQNVSQAFGNTLRRLGLPVIRLHDLRHTSATLALGAGIHPKVVSERLGHSNIMITLETYSHVIPGLHEAAADQLAAVISATSSSRRSESSETTIRFPNRFVGSSPVRAHS